MGMINATIWCELYVDSQRRTNDEYLYKLLEVFPSCDKLTIRKCMHGKKPCHAGLRSTRMI